MQGQPLQGAQKSGLTWLDQMISELIGSNHWAPAQSKAMIVPLTVTLRWDAVDLKRTESSKAQATYLPLHGLDRADMGQVSCC